MLFFGLLTFLFLQIIRPQDFVPGLEGMRLVLYLMVILLTLLLFSPVEKRLLRSPQDKFAGLFLVTIVLSSFTLFWISNVIDTTIATLKLAAMYYTITIIIDDENKFKIAVWAMVVFMEIVVLLCVLHYHGYDFGAAAVYFSPERGLVLEGKGLFDNPNDLSYNVVLVVPFALSLIFQSKGFLGRLAGLFFLSTSIYCIYLTRSRGGQIAVSASLFAWVYFTINNKKIRRRIIIISMLAFLFIVVARSAGYRQDESAMGRIESWSEGWQILKNHPIIGVGKEQFIEYHNLDTHNSFVRAATELGLPGLYAFVGMIYAVGLTILSIQSQPEKNIRWKPYYASLGGFFTAYIVASAFSTRTYELLFFICVAFAGILGRLALKDSNKVSVEGVLFPDETSHLWNKNVFGISVAVLIAWYLFLRQVW
jgi:putative inorganic carbon (hco3(-)) transporter